MLPRAQRLRRSTDFNEVVRQGRRAGSSTLVVYERDGFGAGSESAGGTPLSAPGTRVGFVVGRAVGTAVVRNRVKRRLRQLMAERLSLTTGRRVVVRANPPAAEASYAALAHDVDSCLTRLARRRESALAR